MNKYDSDLYRKMLFIVAFKYRNGFSFTIEEYDFLVNNLDTINSNISRSFDILCDQFDLDSSSREELLNYKVDLNNVIISRC